MKRRSARPFVVEVKSTRSSRSPSTNAFTRVSDSLWQGVSISDHAAPSVPEPTKLLVESAMASTGDAQPQRRVLLALTPSYGLGEPEVDDEIEKTALRRGPAAKLKRMPRSKPDADPTAAPTAEISKRASVSETFDKADEPAPVSFDTTSPSGDVSSPRSNRHHRGQPHPELRRGERWKRRLPRRCW